MVNIYKANMIIYSKSCMFCLLNLLYINFISSVLELKAHYKEYIDLKNIYLEILYDKYLSLN